MIPGSKSAAAQATGLYVHCRTRLAICRCAALKSGATIKRLFNPIAGGQPIASRLELDPERQIRLRVSPPRDVGSGGGGLIEQLRSKL